MENYYNTKAIIFDLDDTLYLERDYIKSGFAEVAKELMFISNAEEKLYNAFIEGKPAIEAVLYEENIYSNEIFEKCLKCYRYHKPTLVLNSKIEYLLTYLRDIGIKLGIITDGRPEGQNAKILSLGLEKYMDKIIITDELGGIQYRKPNKYAFCLMQEYFNVSFREMIYVGDNPKKDFEAPQKLGMKSIRLILEGGLYSEESSFEIICKDYSLEIFHSWDELIQYFLQLFQLI